MLFYIAFLSSTITGGVNFTLSFDFLCVLRTFGGGGGGGAGASFTISTAAGAGGGGGAFATFGGGGGGGGGGATFFDWAINCAEKIPAVASKTIFFMIIICWLRCCPGWFP